MVVESARLYEVLMSTLNVPFKSWGVEMKDESNESILFSAQILSVRLLSGNYGFLYLYGIPIQSRVEVNLVNILPLQL